MARGPILPILFRFLWIALVCSLVWGDDGQPETIAGQGVRVQLMQDAAVVTFEITEEGTVENGGRSVGLAPGRYRMSFSGAKPAAQRFLLFAKTFKTSETAEELAFLEEWRAKGYSPEVRVVGNLFSSRNGKLLDGRSRWVTIFLSTSEAAAKKKKLELERANQWTWIVAERTALGSGMLTVTGVTGKEAAQMAAPLRLKSGAPVVLANVELGYWESRKEKVAYDGPFEFGVGPTGKLEAIQHVEVERYLKGVLPAEMPSSWPAEALEAQAVAARSEVLASMGTKHSFDGFDFCSLEHCRAYRGASGRQPATDAAVDATLGEILVEGGRIVPAVFSSNCGGWTASNETPWRAPADAALRAVSDELKPNRKAPVARGLAEWLGHPPDAYCANDDSGFRWRQTYSEQELRAIVNKQYAIGRIRDIVPGDRGPCGRLLSVQIVGDKATKTVEKELPIRRVFGGLLSAMFSVNIERQGNTVKSVTFTGGGRGHGVGLCQYGAKGMADRELGHEAILKHYFAAAHLEKYH